LYANGDEYVGEWQNHLRHGQGKYMYASSGLQYEGQWRDGKRTGDGEITRIGGQSAPALYCCCLLLPFSTHLRVLPGFR